ncbi:hypothetical protein PR048_009025 [Dryococelus australis]|uniref:Uncharacterized protein n=1 Tax=Dryococelus australis TaxID=614101 RepID=A0ABQ9HYR9_9NEOP|nr:hypothetical protein PR048_009025 [Dryococelus australis]
MSKGHKLWHSAYNSHTSDLLVNDLLPTSISLSSSETIKTSRSAAPTIRLSCTGDSVMFSRDACVSLKSNITVMRKVVANYKFSKILTSVKCLLFYEYFLSQVNDIIVLLDPFSQFINTCQKSECSVADAIELWMILQLRDGHDDKRHLLEKE